MVLYPLTEVPAASIAGQDFQPAWKVVAEKQAQVAGSYWLITQPDHATLAGALAANFVSPRFPSLDEAIVRAIELHDAGWALFPFERDDPTLPPTTALGKPLSFLEVAPEEFVCAWEASIHCAEEVAPAGGIMVSRHFSRLAQGRLAAGADNEEDTRRLLAFLEREERREERLRPHAALSQQQLELLTDVLQFCDLLSLFLCCGARLSVEFPHPLCEETVHLRYRDETYFLDPSPFQGSRGAQSDSRVLRLGVRAWRHPRPPSGTHAARLEFLIC